MFTVQKALTPFQDGGSIILTSLVGGSKGTPALSVYNATKAAIRSFARSWTVDLKHRKIRVNAISPGPTDTPGLSHLFENGHAEQVKTTLLRTIPLGRMGSPDEVAKEFLASDESSFITGIELFVDGGRGQIVCERISMLWNLMTERYKVCKKSTSQPPLSAKIRDTQDYIDEITRRIPGYEIRSQLQSGAGRCR